MYDLHVSVQLYSTPFLEGRRVELMGHLLVMLCSRLYTGCQDQLIDTLFSIASTNWSCWHLSFLPAFVERHMAALGPSEKQGLRALFGTTDLDASAFEKAVLAFMNDALYAEHLL